MLISKLCSAVPKKILVIEDDLDDQFLIAEAFQSSNHPCELTFAVNGKQALDLIERKASQPDLVLLDLNMPVMNGFEVLARLKAESMLPRVPVIVLTTASDTVSIGKSYDLGAYSFIVKPKTFPQLQALTRQLSDYWFQAVRLPKLSD